MNIRVNADRAVLNLTRAQETGFREVVNEQGELVKGPGTTGLKAKLVSLVEQGSVKPGSFAGRIIKAIVGREKFEGISQQLRDNRKTSLAHTLDVFFGDILKGLDEDDDELQDIIADKVQDRLGGANTRYSLRQFTSLRDAITEVIPHYNEHLPPSACRSDSELDAGDKAAQRAGHDGELKSALRSNKAVSNKSVSFGEVYVREDPTISNTRFRPVDLRVAGIKETLDIVDCDTPEAMSLNRNLVKDMYDSLLDIYHDEGSSPRERANAEKLLDNHPVFHAYNI